MPWGFHGCLNKPLTTPFSPLVPQSSIPLFASPLIATSSNSYQTNTSGSVRQDIDDIKGFEEPFRR